MVYGLTPQRFGSPLIAAAENHLSTLASLCCHTDAKGCREICFCLH